MNMRDAARLAPEEPADPPVFDRRLKFPGAECPLRTKIRDFQPKAFGLASCRPFPWNPYVALPPLFVQKPSKVQGNQTCAPQFRGNEELMKGHLGRSFSIRRASIGQARYGAHN
jgi:hypothetical protein